MAVVEGLKRMIDRQLAHGKNEDELKRKEVLDLFKENARAHATAQGKVQGVFYRDFVKKLAEQHGLTGWARNKDDGSVEICAEGDKMALRHFLLKCEKEHPLAQVTSFEYEWETWTGEYTGFFIR